MCPLLRVMDLHAMETLVSAAANWCIWHRDCVKDEWCRHTLTQQVMLWSSVDGPDPYDFDETLVPPRNKAPDPFHVNKNALPSLIERLYKIHGNNVDGFLEWLLARKWGIPDSVWICVLRSHLCACPFGCTRVRCVLVHW